MPEQVNEEFNDDCRWPFWQSLGSPKFVLGPMVDQSDLAFRILCRRYGVDLAYTPMLHSRLFYEDEKYRNRNFQTCEEDQPLIAQFCGSDGNMISRAAAMLEGANAIDINFGCPQGIAKKGYYGAFLLNEPDVIENCVLEVVRSSSLPVTCKIRKVDSNDLQSTLNLAKRLENAGCAAICLHARTKEEKGQFIKKADWDAIKRLKEIINIPVIANGGIENLSDALSCLKLTSADAVMSAEAILEYPAIFSKKKIDIDDLMIEYIEIAEKYSTPLSIIKAHMFHTLYGGLQKYVNLRSQLVKAKNLEDFKSIALNLKELRKLDNMNSKFGWYHRYMKK